MRVDLKSEADLPPRGIVLREAATGKEREETLRTMDELSRRASDRLKALGLTEDDIQQLIDGP